MLVEGGADYMKEDNDGDTPMTLADQEDIKQVMLGEDISSLLLLATHCLLLPLSAAHAARQSRQPAKSPSSSGDNAAASNSPPLTTHRKAFLPRGSSKEGDGDEDMGELAELKAELERKSCMLKGVLMELGTLRRDKELLLSRNRSLEEDLRLRDRAAKMSSHPQEGDPSEQRWFVPREEFSMTEEPINDVRAPYEKFFSVHRGTFRMGEITVRRVRNMSNWDGEVYKTFVKDLEKLR